MSGYFNAFPIIHVRDAQRSLAFYRDLLGFEVTFEWPPEFYSLELKGGGSLAVAQVPDPVVGSFQLCIYTDDVDAAVASLRDSGVPVLQEPEDQPWKERMAYVADPDGHRVMLCARL
jgi:lactoylglutathione lyase